MRWWCWELEYSFPLLCLSSQELQWEEGGDEKNKNFSQAWFIRLLCSLNVAFVDDETRILCIQFFSVNVLWYASKEESRSAAPSSLSSKSKSVVSSGNTERVQERHEKLLSTFRGRTSHAMRTEFWRNVLNFFKVATLKIHSTHSETTHFVSEFKMIIFHDDRLIKTGNDFQKRLKLRYMSKELKWMWN